MPLKTVPSSLKPGNLRAVRAELQLPETQAAVEAAAQTHSVRAVTVETVARVKAEREVRLPEDQLEQAAAVAAVPGPLERLSRVEPELRVLEVISSIRFKLLVDLDPTVKKDENR
jgi:hypothetical protein